jgi:predicted nucleic acid-binding protein
VLAIFDLNDDLEAVLKFLQKYADMPMSLADACLVRMTETLCDPLLLTTDSDFRIYRRYSRQVTPV